MRVRVSTISLSETPVKAQASFADIIETVKLYNINGQILHAVDVGKPNHQVALMIHGWSARGIPCHP
jgi:hypothetical protein